MIRVDLEKYKSVIRNYAGSLHMTETKGTPVSITQHKTKESVTIAQKIEWPKQTIYHIHPTFRHF